MLRRSAFKPRAPAHAAPVDREQRLQERADRAHAAAVMAKAFAVTMTGKSAMPKIEALAANTPVPKEELLCSEPYRRLVAGMPCAHCHIEGLSQHAHENLGKGMGLKVDDRRAMPLCCTQPGREGCHDKFDQGRLLPGGREAHRAAGAQWAAETRADIINRGLWPAKLPLWKE